MFIPEEIRMFHSKINLINKWRIWLHNLVNWKRKICLELFRCLISSLMINYYKFCVSVVVVKWSNQWCCVIIQEKYVKHLCFQMLFLFNLKKFVKNIVCSIKIMRFSFHFNNIMNKCVLIMKVMNVFKIWTMMNWMN